MVVIILATSALLALLERDRRLCFRPSSLFRNYFISDLVYLLTGFVAGGFLATAYVAFVTEWLGESLSLPRLAAHDLPLWISAPVALLSLDGGNYLAHYFLHRFEPLWEFHKVHHSSLTLDWLATFRSHIFEQVFRHLLAPVLLIVVGFPADAVLIAGGVFIAWAMFNHSNLQIDLRFLEPVLITPRLHKAHHLDETKVRNLGTVFSFWDRVRGTFTQVEINDTGRFGNGDNSYPQTWLQQFFEPVRGIGRKGKVQ